MTVGFIILGIFAAYITIIASVAFPLSRTSSPKNVKKLYFTFIAAFAGFPAMAPAATISGIFLPNIAALALFLVFGGPYETIKWYILTWQFHLPSFIITALIMRGIAAVIFYQRKY
jgi:hypothetical protein